ncbi:hypothetical protein HK099_007895 [Clydaea vesicula]|uniref:Uncharacterized protein n=1 Tax=Clydaea vesicula TaxID=447962 RepID=A0AAD5XXX7_9FUNG|nr:hypothetical protein HK099_007895 [Clydaea vesicula]
MAIQHHANVVNICIPMVNLIFDFFVQHFLIVPNVNDENIIPTNDIRTTCRTMRFNSIQQKTYLYENILEFFKKHSRNVEPHELARNFEDFFDEIFSLSLEDNSQYQIGTLLCKLYNEIFFSNSLEELTKLRNWSSMKKSGTVKIVNNEGESTDDDSDESLVDEEMLVVKEKSKIEPVIDDDGFELVQKRRR